MHSYRFFSSSGDWKRNTSYKLMTLFLSFSITGDLESCRQCCTKKPIVVFRYIFQLQTAFLVWNSSSFCCISFLSSHQKQIFSQFCFMSVSERNSISNMNSYFHTPLDALSVFAPLSPFLSHIVIKSLMGMNYPVCFDLEGSELKHHHSACGLDVLFLQS